jgi:CRP-like cAMP-binding protein
MSTAVNPIRITNRLLSALPPEEYLRLSPHLEPVRLNKGRVLQEVGDRVRQMLFLNSGLVSLLPVTENGTTVEAGVVGSEGGIGVSSIPESGRTPYRAVVQIAADALRIDADVLRDEFKRGGRLQDVLLGYALALVHQITQSVVCGRFHTVEERLSRWLLVVSDRVMASTFHLTQESISHILGTPRSGVSVAAAALQKAGLIRYHRGQVHVRNRKGLESAACECYRVLKEGSHFLPPAD